MKSRRRKSQLSPKPWKTISSRTLIDLGMIKLHRDRIVSKTGFRTSSLRLAMRDFSIIVPVLDGNRLVFVWNYRPPIHDWELELPAGLIDDGEAPETGARRELKEETGYSAKTLKSLGWVYTTPGISAQKAHVFIAHGLKKGRIHREPYEYMQVKVLPITQAYNLLWSGGIIHSSTVSALALAEKNLKG